MDGTREHGLTEVQGLKQERPEEEDYKRELKGKVKATDAFLHMGGGRGRYERNKGHRYERSKDATNGAPGLTTRNNKPCSKNPYGPDLFLFAKVRTRTKPFPSVRGPDSFFKRVFVYMHNIYSVFLWKKMAHFL